jgi:DNA-binding transcriptional MerR regulator
MRQQLTRPQGQGRHCPTMYSTQTFAKLTGVTVKALRHYERVGLLEPRRTRARYRRYALGDLQRIERILALKSLGLSLKTIKTVLKRGAIELRAHRASLVEKRVRLDRAIAVLEEIEQDARPRAAIQRFVGEASWDRFEAKRRNLAVDRPPDRAPASALALFREIAAALDAGAAVENSRQLIARCRDVVAPETIDAWRRRASWPSGLRRYVASCYVMEPDTWERVVAFMEGQGCK